MTNVEQTPRGGIIRGAVNRARQFNEGIESRYASRMTPDRQWLRESNAATTLRGFHSAARRIESELGGGVVEQQDGTKEFFFDPRTPLLLKSPWAMYQTVFGSAFGSVDRIGKPHQSEPQIPVGTFRRGEQLRHRLERAHKGLTTMRGISDYFRNAVYGVNYPQNPPRIPSGLKFAFSYVPVLSWLQDVGAARDLLRSTMVVAEKVPVVGRAFRGVTPQPGRLASDAIIVGSDIIHLTTGGTSKFFVPMPGSVSVIRPEQYADTRIKQQYLPETMAKELLDAVPGRLTQRQALFVGAVNRMITRHRDELLQTDLTVTALLQRAGINSEPFIQKAGIIRRKLRDSKTRTTTLSREEEAKLNGAIVGGRYTPQELSRLFSGLDVLEAVSETMRINRGEQPVRT